MNMPAICVLILFAFCVPYPTRSVITYPLPASWVNPLCEKIIRDCLGKTYKTWGCIWSTFSPFRFASWGQRHNYWTLVGRWHQRKCLLEPETKAAKQFHLRVEKCQTKRLCGNCFFFCFSAKYFSEVCNQITHVKWLDERPFPHSCDQTLLMWECTVYFEIFFLDLSATLCLTLPQTSRNIRHLVPGKCWIYPRDSLHFPAINMVGTVTGWGGESNVCDATC